MTTTTREITVRVDEDAWHVLSDAAECAGMSLENYVCWAVRLLALQSGPAGPARRTALTRPKKRKRKKTLFEEPESAVWEQTFAERLTHRTEQFREV